MMEELYFSRQSDKLGVLCDDWTLKAKMKLILIQPRMKLNGN